MVHGFLFPGVFRVFLDWLIRSVVKNQETGDNSPQKTGFEQAKNLFRKKLISGRQQGSGSKLRPRGRGNSSYKGENLMQSECNTGRSSWRL